MINELGYFVKKNKQGGFDIFELIKDGNIIHISCWKKGIACKKEANILCRQNIIFIQSLEYFLEARGLI